MADPGTSTTSAKIDDENRGIIREPNLKQKRSLLWRNLEPPADAGKQKSTTTAKGTNKPLEPQQGITSEEVDPAGRYVDDFLEGIYDIDDSAKQGHLSKRFTLVYSDGTRIKINLDEIGDANFVRFDRDQPFFVVGRGGRTFPRVMTRGTVPNLWSVKQRVLVIIEEFNADYSLFMNLTLFAISFVFPPPTAGLPWSFRATTGRSGKPLDYKAYDKLNVTLNRIKRRLGRPHIPEEIDAPRTTPPKSLRGRYATLPKPGGGEISIPPDTPHGRGYHGTKYFTPEEIVRLGGIPAKTDDPHWNLLKHTDTFGSNTSAFRGITPFLRSPVKGGNQGAAEWAVHDADVGYIYLLEDVPIWDVNKHLQGRIPDALVGFKSARPGTSGEVESVTVAQVPLEKIKGVWRVTKVDGEMVIEKLDWGAIKARTHTGGPEY